MRGHSQIPAVPTLTVVLLKIQSRIIELGQNHLDPKLLIFSFPSTAWNPT